jgi:hypothetical protein
VARNEFAATFTSSAVTRSVTSTGVGSAITGAKAARSQSSARCEVTPKTSRSGRMVSSTAYPSRRNSGFQASSTPVPAGASRCTSSVRRAAVPTGTVDLPTTRQGRSRWTASALTAAST